MNGLRNILSTPPSHWQRATGLVLLENFGREEKMLFCIRKLNDHKTHWLLILTKSTKKNLVGEM
jgi:hypothetical protein